MTATEPLPLFPLHTVLLPGAPLGLRVFERRYLDLVAECGRNGRGFGICMILEGEEVGAPATPAAFGVEAPRAAHLQRQQTIFPGIEILDQRLGAERG